MINLTIDYPIGYLIVNGPSTIGEAISHFCKLHEGDEMFVNFLLDLYNAKDDVSIAFYNDKLLQFPRHLNKKNRINYIFDCLNDHIYFSNGDENIIYEIDTMDEEV